MRISKKSVRFEIGIWRGPKGDIHITATDTDVKKLVQNFHSTVNDRESSIRCHKKLYEKLEAVLIAAGV